MPDDVPPPPEPEAAPEAGAPPGPEPVPAGAAPEAGPDLAAAGPSPPPRRRRSWKRLVGYAALGAVALFGLIQLVPYGRSHTNPPVTGEPSWDSPRTRELARVACFDCHSNETAWPWYSNVAPASWLVQKDVDEGRDTLNFSEWDRPQPEAEDAAEAVSEGDMPPWQYKLLHGSARLSDAQTAALAAGLRRTMARSGVRP